MNDNHLYIDVPLEDSIAINSIVTIHYLEFAKDYVFSGESHNFWEFMYVDKGEVEILAGEVGYQLKQGDIVFHKPNEFHSVWANKVIAPNILVISFVCNSKDMSFFENKILSPNASEVELLSKIYEEGKNTFSTDLNTHYPHLTKKYAQDVYASEQLLKLYLEMFLINLIRSSSSIQSNAKASNQIKHKMENDIVDEIIAYMKQNLYNNFTFDDVCSHFFIGKTHLKTIFKHRTAKGVMSYFQGLKIEEAKRLIREENHNFSQISELLNYDTVHYFSRCFKNSTNMTPTQYSQSIKAL